MRALWLDDHRPSEPHRPRLQREPVAAASDSLPSRTHTHSTGVGCAWRRPRHMSDRVGTSPRQTAVGGTGLCCRRRGRKRDRPRGQHRDDPPPATARSPLPVLSSGRINLICRSSPRRRRRPAGEEQPCFVEPKQLTIASTQFATVPAQLHRRLGPRWALVLTIVTRRARMPSALVRSGRYHRRCVATVPPRATRITPWLVAGFPGWLPANIADRAE